MAIKKNRVPVRSQLPEERITNFDEVCFGYNASEAIQEAERCIQCKNPRCVQACPVYIKIPQFIKAVAESRFGDAVDIIAEDSSLPAVCGRVCPQEVQCEGSCVMGIKGEPISIGKLERFVADWGRTTNYYKPTTVEQNSYKVAVIGSGPAGSLVPPIWLNGLSSNNFRGVASPGRSA